MLTQNQSHYLRGRGGSAPESDNSYRKRQVDENGGEIVRTSKGTCKVESVRGRGLRPDCSFLCLVLLVWARASGRRPDLIKLSRESRVGESCKDRKSVV